MAAIATAFVVYYATHNTVWTAAAAGAAFSAVAALLPDNTSNTHEKTALEKLVKDAVLAVAEHKELAALPSLALDVKNVVVSKSDTTETMTSDVTIATEVAPAVTVAEELVQAASIAPVAKPRAKSFKQAEAT